MADDRFSWHGAILLVLPKQTLPGDAMAKYGKTAQDKVEKTMHEMHE